MTVELYLQGVLMVGLSLACFSIYMWWNDWFKEWEDMLITVGGSLFLAISWPVFIPVALLCVLLSYLKRNYKGKK